MRVGGVLHDFPKGWLRECEAFLDQLEKNMVELDRLLTGNEIFESRTQGVGYIDPQQALAYGLTGPMLRASGINWDVRVNRPYMAYREVPVNPQVRQEGDCFARYRGAYAGDHGEHSSLSGGNRQDARWSYQHTYADCLACLHEAKPTLRIESSKGELGVYLISDGSEYPWRAKLRGPSFVNLQILPEVLRGHKMSDAVAIMGSLDLVLGEVDR